MKIDIMVAINVTPYRMIQICEECVKSEMFLIGESKFVSFPQYEHQYKVYSEKRYSTQKYPFSKYRRET